LKGHQIVTATITPYVACDLDGPDRRDGKVRSSYRLRDGNRLIVTTDRLSAFDRIIAGVPYKGQVLNQLAAWWFEQTRDIVGNHVVSLPDPNALVAREANPLPVEVVVRGRITGVTSTSLWKRYAAGDRVLYGHRLPDGLKKNESLPEPLITPTTKAEKGAHDEALTVAEVVERGLLSVPLWTEVQDIAVALFKRGVERAAKAGLVLADTKYEFGVTAAGELLVIDEIHTPDSSRFWVADSLEGRLAKGEEPESLDKEVVRKALDAAGFRGDGEVPDLPQSVWTETSERYISCYERLTGRPFERGAYPIGPRLAANVKGLF
jgi:phosphoribosylaminoimidazole-succinocarboxamide synthase